MARFDMLQEQILSKNEQIYKHCLQQLLGDCDAQQLLNDSQRFLTLNNLFIEKIHEYPLTMDQRMLRAAQLGDSSFFNAPNCFAYIGESNILLERHDRYFPIAIHSHSFLELMCLVNGHCFHRINDQIRELQTGDIICLPPGTYHTFTSFSDDCIVYNLSIQLDDFEARFYKLLQSGTALASFLSQTLYADRQDTWMIFHSGTYLLEDNPLATIWQLQHTGGSLVPVLLNTFTELFLLELSQLEPEQIEMHLTPAEPAAIDRKLLSYIRLRFRTVTLAELSEVFNYSERHISRIIHQATGSTLGAYLQQLRLEQIAQLLKYPELSIAAVFDLVGVKNRSYFYRIFRNHFGVTPAQYRAAYLSQTGVHPSNPNHPL